MQDSGLKRHVLSHFHLVVLPSFAQAARTPAPDAVHEAKSKAYLFLIFQISIQVTNKNIDATRNKTDVCLSASKSFLLELNIVFQMASLTLVEKKENG